MEKEKSVEVLNSLLQINNDRIEGYETASKETEEQDLKSFFSELMHTSNKCSQELIDEIQKLGGTPTEGTKISGKFFRVWMDVKAALTGKDRKAILNSCEFGEDAALKTYNDVLSNEDENLTQQQQSMVKAQEELLRADHDKVKTMRDMLVEN